MLSAVHSCTVSLHPLSSEMIVSEVVVSSAAAAGGVACWSSGHGVLGGVAFAVAALVLSPLAVLAVTERDTYPPALVAARVGAALLSVAWLFCVGWGARTLFHRGSTLLAVLAVLAGLFGVPLAAIALRSRLERAG